MAAAWLRLPFRQSDDLIDLEAALATAIDEESRVGTRWWPGEEMAPIVVRRWFSFSRRHKKTKRPAPEQRERDLVKSLQAHYEPDIPYTPLSDWLQLARLLSEVIASEQSTIEK